MASKPTIVNEEYQYGFNDGDVGVLKFARGLSRETVEEISRIKQEPKWMLDFRLHALDVFYKKPMQNWGADLSKLNFDDIIYYVKPSENQGRTWEEVPQAIKDTFERLGIPEAERKFLAGVSAQYESEVVYHSIRKDLEEKGIIFLDTDSALREYPDLVREYFGTVIPPKTTNLPRLTPLFGPAARSSISRKGSKAIFRSRHISALIRKTWASLNAP